jgi:hypothetical protein
MQAPGRPILSWLIDTFPHVHKSWRVDVGYSRLNYATIFWQSGGIEAFDVGCGPATAGRPVQVAAGIGAPVNFGGGPKNNASGHISVSWMEQSSTSWRTALGCRAGEALSIVPAFAREEELPCVIVEVPHEVEDE